MSYLEEFQRQLNNHNYQAFMQLWEEYCAGDIVDGPELLKILQVIKQSDFAPTFGKQVDTALALWKQISNEEDAYKVFGAIIDLQTTNDSELANLTLEILTKRYIDKPYFHEKIRLVGLRNRDIFQGAVTNFELLTHMEKGKFVFHTGGWGTGEIVELSLVREQLVLEFEHVTGRKEVSFSNAFKTLIPLSDSHFLARRFGNPDLLEEEARKDPASVIRLLLQDLGPKNATEIKEELCDWVIPEQDWSKWWQSARSKIKKDTRIESPSQLKDPFSLRQSEVSHEERLKKALFEEKQIYKAIELLYAFIRDHGSSLKSAETKNFVEEKINELLQQELVEAQKVQLEILLAALLNNANAQELLKSSVQHSQAPSELVHQIPIVALKKHALLAIREVRSDWAKIFLELLGTLPVQTLRDYIVKELAQSQDCLTQLKVKLQALQEHPSTHPELFVWYFQKIVADESLPFSDKEGRCKFLESLLMLLNQIEQLADYRDLVKKIHNLLSSNRFAIVRSIIEDTSIEYLQEFLLLISKCQSLDDHDSKILRSLAEVVHPSLAKQKRGRHEQLHEDIIWTTPEGYRKIQTRIQQIGTLETVENAKEIEVARAHGDLRENSEYKFALEKRARLQGELKLLTTQLNKARFITADDIAKDEVSVGSIIEVANSNGEKSQYTLLGPWEADPDKKILSSQSKFAQAVIGLKVGDKFKFQEDEHTLLSIRSYLD